MGLVAAGCWLAPNANSLRSCIAGPSSSQLLTMLTLQYHSCGKKSNVFLSKIIVHGRCIFVQNRKIRPARTFLLTKQGLCAYNRSNSKAISKNCFLMIWARDFGSNRSFENTGILCVLGCFQKIELGQKIRPRRKRIVF